MTNSHMRQLGLAVHRIFSDRTKGFALLLLLAGLAAAVFLLFSRPDNKELARQLNRPVELGPWADRVCELHGKAADIKGDDAKVALSRIQKVIVYDFYHRLLFERLGNLLTSLDTEKLSNQQKSALLRLVQNTLNTQIDANFEQSINHFPKHHILAQIQKQLSACVTAPANDENAAADPEKRLRNVARKTYELLQRLRDEDQQYIAPELLDLNVNDQRTIKDVRNILRQKEADYLLARDRELISCFTSYQTEAPDPVPHIQQICNQQRIQPLYDEVTGAIDGWWRNPNWLARGVITHIATPAELRMIRAKIIAEAYLSKINQLETTADFLESRESIEFIKRQESLETLLDRISARDMTDEDIAEAYNQAGRRMKKIYDAAKSGERDNVQTVFDLTFMPDYRHFVQPEPLASGPISVLEFVTRTLSGHSILESAYDPMEVRIIKDWTTYLHAEMYRMVSLSDEDMHNLIAMPMSEKQPKNGM